MNFEWFLVFATIITGTLFLLSFSRRFAHSKNKIMSWLLEQGAGFFPVFVIVLFLRSFLFEPFRIPSGSLEPTLNVGDFVLVNKFSYGFRLPIINKTIIGVAEPGYGDIAVFRWPPDQHFDFIKRVVGLPGDKVSYHNKQLTINGRIMSLTKITEEIDESSGKLVECYEEDLMGVKHKIYQQKDASSKDFDWIIPKDSYLMMGDNRDDSADSRYWGFVPNKLLRGKAVLVWLSWNGYENKIRWSNIGKWIH